MSTSFPLFHILCHVHTSFQAWRCLQLLSWLCRSHHGPTPLDNGGRHLMKCSIHSQLLVSWAGWAFNHNLSDKFWLGSRFWLLYSAERPLAPFPCREPGNGAKKLCICDWGFTSLVPRLSWNANIYRAESLVSFVRKHDISKIGPNRYM